MFGPVARVEEMIGRIKQTMDEKAPAPAAVEFRKADYDAAALAAIVPALLDGTGMRPIERGMRVLIKPNFLAPAGPERAMTTHPLVLRAVVEHVLARGGRATVADSPGRGSFEQLLHKGGYAQALAGLDVVVKPFRDTVGVDVGEPFGRIELAREAVEADLVVNLPKLKTHAMTLLTLGVKNLFGCVVGSAKPEWHFRSGIDRDLFSRLLVQICRAVNPAVTLIDGILAMEGEGPGRSGTPRRLGVLAASASALALDAAVCRLVGIRPEELPTHQAARSAGLIAGEPETRGDFRLVAGFRLPVLGPLTFGPQRLHPLMRRHLVQRPVAIRGRCRLCGECWRCCPAKAITPHAETVGFDYDRCIRCYCCIEMCPHAALKTAETPAGRAARKLAGLRDRITHRTGLRLPRRRAH
jgi:uncharacterized protein (DUF362 family)/Pyruvate/2-oxoacid:ferredoxin oxidoreductase delta subunit